MTGREANSTHTSCLLCQGLSIRPLAGYEAAGLVRCHDCRFVFSRYMPTVAELIAHYDTYPRHDRISDITLKRYDALAELLSPYATERHWLDVGCGDGHLLARVQKHGWIVYGTEYTDTAVEICKRKGISMQQGPLHAAQYTPNSFDVITFIEVLEHINNPHEELENFRKLLRAGGALYITTPNFNAISRHLLKANWSIIEYPEHLCYYTPSTLHRLLHQHGFKRVTLTSTGITPSRLFRAKSKKEGTNNEQKISPILPDEKLRTITDSNPLGAAAKKMINGVLSLTGKGDTLKALYTKI